MKESTRAAALVTARLLIALACVVTVVVARPTVGWGSLAVMLVALAVLIGLLADYNRKFR
ncbi:hypothetical protein [Micromonospora sp. C28ISP2-4]|uniref:DUF6903 family protein n=1 Tax=Micromonospora sp. C28ISP2-4 TaxID=3059523 RepID=UPI002676A35A|nr:hypothetical protein [Micromonospora sp. C28ISP2-4]MDO3686880.1 hypothetical protein [Micromonospora sp. C28ISP2-4]